jgi:protein-arginine kinase activator protein McsA
MKSAMAEHYCLEPTLTQRLADAIAAEQYELAAKLRDQIERRNRGEK